MALKYYLFLNIFKIVEESYYIKCTMWLFSHLQFSSVKCVHIAGQQISTTFSSGTTDTLPVKQQLPIEMLPFYRKLISWFP